MGDRSPDNPDFDRPRVAAAPPPLAPSLPRCREPGTRTAPKRYRERVVRTWLRQALGASGVALLVPAAVAAALVLTAALGGGGFGALGQVVSGPTVPAAEA